MGDASGSKRLRPHFSTGIGKHVFFLYHNTINSSVTYSVCMIDMFCVRCPPLSWSTCLLGAVGLQKLPTDAGARGGRKRKDGVRGGTVRAAAQRLPERTDRATLRADAGVHQTQPAVPPPGGRVTKMRGCQWGRTELTRVPIYLWTCQERVILRHIKCSECFVLLDRVCSFASHLGERATIKGRRFLRERKYLPGRKSQPGSKLNRFSWGTRHSPSMQI